MKQRVIYIIAGEASGDFLGAQLIQSLHQQAPEAILRGIGGNLMTQQGFNSLFPMHELSLMGLVEILPHIPRLYRRIQETVKDIINQKPDVLVTLDSPGFCHRVAKAAKKKLPNLKVVHYVAPSVWAWRPGRAKKIAQWVDHLLTLFPFEPSYFTVHGLATTFVGHPLLEQSIYPDATFRGRYGIADSALVLVLLPGSRLGELKRLLLPFCQTAVALSRDYPDFHVIVPALPFLEQQVKQALDATGLRYTLVTSPVDKYAAFAASDLALAASGTVCLELALMNVPMVIGYKVSFVTYALLKRLVRTKVICLINILLNNRIISEHIQHDCTVKALKTSLVQLLQGQGEVQKCFMQKAIQLLKNPQGQNPSQKAAEVILAVADAKTADRNEL